MTIRIKSASHLIGFALAVSVLAATAPVAAAETAEQLVIKGLDLRRRGEHERALELFQRAHAQDASAMTLAQIGIAEQSLKRWTDAEAHLAAALESSTSPWIQKNRSYLEQALASVRAHIGQLLVRGTAGAAVSVDGQAQGALPLASPIRLGEGNVRVQVTAAGHHPKIEAATIRPGTTAELDATLEGMASAPTPLSLSAASDHRAHADSPSSWPSTKIAGVTLVGASLAAVAAGVAFLMMDGKGICDRPADGQCIERYRTNIQGWALLGGGIAAGAAGGVLLYRNSRAQISVGITRTSIVAGGCF